MVYIIITIFLKIYNHFFEIKWIDIYYLMNQKRWYFRVMRRSWIFSSFSLLFYIKTHIKNYIS